MSRLGRDKQRNQERTELSAAPAATPIDVRVPGGGPAGAGPAGAGEASVDGVTVVAAPGEEIQHAVLDRLHRIALAAGRPVLATVHDERIGYVVPLRVDPDGSSHLAAEAVPAARPESSAQGAIPDTATQFLRPVEPVRSVEPVGPVEPVRSVEPVPETESSRPAAPEPPRSPAGESAPTFTLRALPAPGTVAPPTGVFGPPPLMDAPPATATGEAPHTPEHAPGDRPTGPTSTPLNAPDPEGTPARPFPEPAPAAGADQPSGPVPAVSHESSSERIPASGPDWSTESGPDRSTTSGPDRSTDWGPERTPDSVPDAPHGPVTEPAAASGPEPTAGPAPEPTPGPALRPVPEPAPAPRSEPVRDVDPKPTPPRGFDAVAEAVLGDGPLTAPGDGDAPALLAEPTARINDAVKAGRTDTATRLAEQTLAEATETLGPEHPEVLRLRELTAYIAYLSGDPDRAFRLSLDLARIHRRAGDAEAAYGNVQSAATAWRAVRDPARGLELGQDLVGLWSGLAAEEGPAADDAEQLESARARMERLAERARAQSG
ncbi:tetratricopeptide repeat protein [Streptomyces sp. TRM S81-3]|uniref:Tetratricopeptide repeat protein n=1 Tax=Streptomyces griseicoloratus TaxID=2752516 RepID=A0A926L3R8_9ACTN|nr:tetratricopeptide repeat protein [Streptomyces griseicoloratus]MBD0421995.1 tetratricopeptide repeat protein [Streptomyces griseicoloratus]